MSWRRVHAIRGATTVDRDEALAIVSATRELLEAIVCGNSLGPDEVVSAIFSVTPDLTTEFPARAARELGWDDVALFCATEMQVPLAPARCIRVLLHVESASPRSGVTHVYLRDARQLRPEWGGTPARVSA
jgi:chorismate mutase